MTTPPYIEVFGGGPIWPSSVSYVQYDLDALDKSIILELPQVATTEFVTAGTMNFLTTDTAHTVTMPDVSIVSPGYTFWVRNSGSVDLTIFKNDGTTLLLTITAGLTYFIQVIDNSTANGLWYTGQFGAGSSIVTSAQLTGPGITLDPLDLTRLATQILSREFNTPGYTIAPIDRANLLIWTGGTATIFLPDVATLGDGFLVYISNQSVGGLLTIQCATGGQLINGLPFITCNPGSSFEIVASDGMIATASNYYTIGIAQTSVGTATFLDGSIAAPSINFRTDETSGFSHQFTDFSDQAISISLNGILQASFSSALARNVASFVGSVASNGFKYVYGTGGATLINESSTFLSIDGDEHILNFSIYNDAGNFVNMSLSSTGVLSYQTDGGANPLDIHASTATISPGPGLNLQRDGISYLAWARIMM